MDGVSLSILTGAVSVAFFHTLLGPDHTLPFIMLARSERWSTGRALLVTFLCGLGHVGASLLLGGLGIALGYGIGALESAETSRGAWAAWALFAFGFAYMIWGLRLAWRRRSGMALHDHAGHVHVHGHGDHEHAHESANGSRTTFWVLFAVFVLGPCEPLIPLLMYPAAQHNIGGVVFVTLAFGVTTILTMLVIIAAASWGVRFIRLGFLERYVHAIAGAMIFISGMSVQFLGL